MTLQEFVHLYETEGPFELVQGERTPLMANHFDHDNAANNMANAFNGNPAIRKLGKAFVEATFVRIYDENISWVKGSRQPDVLFVSLDDLLRFKEAYPDYGLPMVLIPQIVVEIISTHDKAHDLENKVKEYLADGVLLIWVVNPYLRTVTVYQQGSKQAALLSEEDTLSGGDVLPEFNLTVSEIFRI
jgi:Uma2 family endonuclease